MSTTTKRILMMGDFEQLIYISSIGMVAELLLFSLLYSRTKYTSLLFIFIASQILLVGIYIALTSLFIKSFKEFRHATDFTIDSAMVNTRITFITCMSLTVFHFLVIVSLVLAIIFNAGIPLALSLLYAIPMFAVGTSASIIIGIYLIKMDDDRESIQ